MERRLRGRAAAAAGAALAGLALVTPLAAQSGAVGGFFQDATPVPAAFKAKVKAPFQVIDLSLSQDHASLETKDPQQKDTFDRYDLRRGGQVSEPEPVQVFTVNCKKGFGLDEADFTAVPAMVEDAVARLAIEGGKATLLNLSRGVFCKEVRWTVHVDGTRKDGTVEYDPKGKFRNAKVL
jgi:hypothetical protein